MNCFDMHSDIFTDITNRRLRGETDVFKKHHLERLRRGSVEGGIFVVWTDPPVVSYEKRTHQIFDCVRKETETTRSFRRVRNYREMMEAKNEGIFYVFSGVEGMAYVDEDIARVDEYFDFGVRFGMLTWNEVNALGAGAKSGVSEGLTAMGKLAVKRMYDLGMVVDVSHLNEKGFWDIAAMDRGPFIASHSNASALCDVPRNLTDDQLRALRDAGGVAGLNAYAPFVNKKAEEADVDGLARHAGHMIDVMGIDHVGCGFDFFEFIYNKDTVDSFSENRNSSDVYGIEGLRDASEAQHLFECFAHMGLSREEQEKIAFGNIHRIIREILD